MSTLSRVGSGVGDVARRADPARFFTSLFAPAERRNALWTLYAFNHELARAPESVREPMMAMIRLQWWREVVEGAARRHEVAEPVHDALATGALRQADLLALVEAREADAPESAAEWTRFVQATAGTLATAAAHALGEDDVEAVRLAGSAYGAAGVLRNRALRGQPAVTGLREAAVGFLQAARSRPIPRHALAAALPAVFAERDLGRATPVRLRGLGDKLAVTRSALMGRL